MRTARHARMVDCKPRTTRVGAAVAWAALLALFAVSAMAAGCAQAPEQPETTEAPSPDQSTMPAAAQPLEITFQSQPDPPRTGENTFEVTVKGPDDVPVTDADVSVVFYMPAMPAMNMPEMRNRVSLRHEAAGRYRGTGSVMMAGAWDVTVSVQRQGTEIGSGKFSVTAQ